jgi:ABC-type antimicrobial peptide transport system permease subunit
VDLEGVRIPTIYHAHTQWAGNRNWDLTQVVATSGAPDAPLGAIRTAVAALDPQLVVYHAQPLDDVLGQGSAQRAFTLYILLAFAAIALALAALGLFGVLSYTVKLRSREFGIRMALGAERGAIRRLVLLQGMRVTVLGTAAGVLGAIALSRIMAPLVFQESTLDPRVLAAAALFLGAVAAVAAYVPARRATSVEPRTALQ